LGGSGCWNLIGDRFFDGKGRAYGSAPGFGAEYIGFGFEMTLGDGREEAAECGAKIAGGDVPTGGHGFI
jgi:hypothetical protein